MCYYVLEQRKNGVIVLQNNENVKAVEETYGTSISEKDIVRMAMAIRGYNQTSLARELGYAHQSGVSAMLRGTSMSVDNFVMVMNKMGFDIMVVDNRNKKSGIEWTVAGGIDRPRTSVRARAHKGENLDGDTE